MAAYKHTWAVFSQFLNDHTLPHTLPVPWEHVLLFIVNLKKSSYAARTISAKLSALAFVHKLYDFPDPTNNFLVRKTMVALHKSSSAKIRLPISRELLHQLVNALTYVTSQVYQQKMFKAMFLLAFYAFLRVGELTNSANNLLVSDVTFTDQGATLTFRSFKHSDGQHALVNIQKYKEQGYCPVMALQRFLLVRGCVDGPLFANPSGYGISRHKFVQILNNALKFCGINVNSYNSHSFRIGAASFWAQQGASEAQIRLWGRWKSDAFKSYMRTVSMKNLPFIPN